VASVHLNREVQLLEGQRGKAQFTLKVRTH